MAEEYEYFIKVPEGYTEERPDGLWRRAGDRWEYLSLIDWSWHAALERVPPPRHEWPETLYRRVSAERAADLAADRQRWVRYWAAYFDEPEPGEEPFAVLRRRRSPELVLDEAFVGDDDTWQRTPLVVEGHVRRGADAPCLVELDVESADRFIEESEGVRGATAL